MPGERAYPELTLGGGVKLRFVRVFSADRDAERKFRLGDIAGEPDPDSVHASSKPNEAMLASNSDVVVDFPHRERAVRDRSTVGELADVIAGTLPNRELRMTLPYRIATDSTGRVIVTDPPRMLSIFSTSRRRSIFVFKAETASGCRPPGR